MTVAFKLMERNKLLIKQCWEKASHLQNSTFKQVELRFTPKSIYKYKLQLDKGLKHEKPRL